MGCQVLFWNWKTERNQFLASSITISNEIEAIIDFQEKEKLSLKMILMKDESWGR
jgi:hypothetical protein